MSSTMVATFRVAGALYGVPADQVQEVLRHPAPTPVPLAANHVAGLINLRGTVVCGVDLRARLSLPDQAAPVSIVVRHAKGTAALLVDEIADVFDVDDACFGQTPSTVAPEVAAYLSGVYSLDDTLLSILDVDSVVAA